MTFKTKELIFIALMAAALFVINLVIGSGIIAVTEVPGTNGFVTGLTNLIFITFVALVLKRFWSVTTFYIIYGILTIPTSMGGGPPGFIFKIIPLVITAFIFEVVIKLFNYKKKGFIIALLAFVVLGIFAYILTYWILGMPELTKILRVWPIMAIFFIILGYLGMWLGFKIYDRTKNKRVVLQITS